MFSNQSKSKAPNYIILRHMRTQWAPLLCTTCGNVMSKYNLSLDAEDCNKYRTIVLISHATRRLGVEYLFE